MKIKSLGRSAITIYGTEKLLEWVKEQKPELHRWSLSELNHHPNIYLVDDEDQNCWGDCFQQHFETIFKNQLLELGLQVPEKLTLEQYREMFRYEYHEFVYDLSEDELTIEEEWYQSC